ncbi:MAG: exodeoxyribonuclease VII large subunit [Deltaproteobacteria bacterium]|nr:MAG: exodeoxyribonuclease VII large subunit [Deltaproteobacteria bacterium]
MQVSKNPSQKPHADLPGRRIFSVSELTRSIRDLLENGFPFVWISGEISNLRIPSSGHAYFTLKDARSQISGVMFNGQRRQLKFKLADGMAITALGRITVYEPRGNYQLLVEYVEPTGTGSLQLAYEQLKARLHDEGLFDAAAKQQLPLIPRCVGLITSGTGAVMHDFIKTARRRFPSARIRIFPVRVQGDGAEAEIAGALDRINQDNLCDLVVIARGGGSLEDLMAFNGEHLARRVFASQIPVVSAVGHETDYTIADFVADLRAPTPTAAAELIFPVQAAVFAHLNQQSTRLVAGMTFRLKAVQSRLDTLETRLRHPRRQLEENIQRLDILSERLVHAMTRHQHRCELIFSRSAYHLSTGRLVSFQLDAGKEQVNHLASRFSAAFRHLKNREQARVSGLNDRLYGLSPHHVLDRGYVMIKNTQSDTVIQQVSRLAEGDRVTLVFADGTAMADIIRITPHEPKNL